MPENLQPKKARDRESGSPDPEGLDEKDVDLDEDGSIKSSDNSDGQELFEKWGSKAAGKNKQSVYEFI